MFCAWALGVAMVVGFVNAVGLVAAVYSEYRWLVRASVLLIVVSAVVTTGCSWGMYTV